MNSSLKITRRIFRSGLASARRNFSPAKSMKACPADISMLFGPMQSLSLPSVHIPMMLSPFSLVWQSAAMNGIPWLCHPDRLSYTMKPFSMTGHPVVFLIFSKPIFLQFSINSDFTETSSYIPVCIRLHFPVYNPSCKSDTCSLRGLKTWNRTHPMTYGSYIRKISPQQEISYACQK